MAGEHMKEDTLPLIVCDETGRFLFLAYTNRKGYTKSIEQGALWAIHPDTDRLLPNGNEARLKTMEDREFYYYAEVSLSSSSDLSERNLQEEAAGSTHSVSDHPVSQPPEPSFPRALEGILDSLIQVIKERKANRPEGSYTTYLFNSGIEKIRKKTGEEAIELILARRREDIAFEAADLIYHLLVLLEAEDIDLQEVLEELNRRR